MNRPLPTLSRSLLPAVLVVAALAVIAMPATAAAAGRRDLAVATLHAGGVDFLPAVAYGGAKITVTGPELDYERSFAAGERLSIDLFDPDGQLLPDGTYTWRLALTPTAEDARALRRSARRNGGISPDRWLALSGSFTLRSGLVVDPSLAEARPARAEPALGGGLARDLGATAAADGIGDDSDAAIAAGARPSTALSPSAGKDQADATALADGPSPAAPVVTEKTMRRSYPTDGKNGRDN